MPQLELKSLQTFLAIKRCELTKIEKVIKQSRRVIKVVAYLQPGGIPVLIDHNMVV